MSLAPNTLEVLLDRGVADEHFGHLVDSSIELKLTMAIDAMTLVIDKLGVFRLRVNEPTFASMLHEDTDIAKNTMIKDDGSDSTTLHDLMGMQPREAARRFARMDCYELARSAKLWKLDREPRLACYSLLLIHCRLPILCGDVICDNLNNEDLFNICLAVEGQGRARDAERND
ncbi:hypothetical protein TKK_0018021 [Trichogramma kaykai]